MASLHPIPPFDELTYYPMARWIRATRGGDTIVDTRQALLVWEPGRRVPSYAFPYQDVVPEAAAEGRGFDDSDLNGYVTVSWNAAEHWYEEDEEVFVHPRDPFVRVDAIKSSRHVRVERDGRQLAESGEPILVFETGLPTRYYLNRYEINFDHLVPTDTVTECPYKGTTSAYWSIQVGDEVHPDLAWSYDFPTRQLLPIAGLIAFYNERVDIIVDGQRLERPRTHFFPSDR